jgi:hypothetical protein
MADFNIRSDSVNVEQIMEQIRARIREKRGVDYTEQQISELAAVKMEKFLDARGVRSDLLEEFRRLRPASDAPTRPRYEFHDETLFETHRGPIRFMRRLLRPVLKLFFNPNPLIQVLHIQSQLNDLEVQAEASRRAREQLTFEVMHNLVLEATRMGIEVKNLKMRVESLSSRLEFNERRARLLESAVVYKGTDPTTEPVVQQPAATGRREFESRPIEPRPQADYRPRPEAVPDARAPFAPQTAPGGQPAGPDGPGQRSRRRRRRRGRRGGASAASVMGTAPMPNAGPTLAQAEGHASDSEGHPTGQTVEPPSSNEPPEPADVESGDPDPNAQ